ncbi:MAG: aryl-sulfate sulfotransferase [Alphaproteobacteria bacterium]|nr:aryl-sulfate sulfotransferase [Alphaproteobacteria bacterium]MCB9695826.1 aryl-sulfate sulfotransferase [Alphaproteobacteria bacterium]
MEVVLRGWLALVVLGCGSGSDKDGDGDADGITDVDPGDADTDTDSDTDSDTDADADSDADTDTETTVTGACAPTDNPLRFSCTFNVDPPQPLTLSWHRTDGASVERSAVDDAATTEHTLTALFLAHDQDYDWSVIPHTTSSSPALTGTLSAGTPPPNVLSRFDMTGASTMGLVGGENPCSNDATAVIYDTNTGDLVWYQDLNPAGTLGPDAMVRFQPDRTVLAETDGQVVKVDLEGNDLLRLDLDYPGLWGLHHDIYEWNGLIYLLHQEDVGGGLILDTVWIVDQQGDTVAEWLADDHLNIPGNASGDYLHTNSLNLDAAGNMYLSFFYRHTVAKLVGDPADPSFGDVIWLMAGDPPNQIGNDITVDWSAVGGADSFRFQHHFQPRANGGYTLLDNDHGRALIVSVDEGSGQAVVEGAFATREARCGPQGTAAEVASNGNVVAGCWGDWLREYDDTSGAQVWEGHLVCQNTPQGGPKVARYYPLDTW